MRTVIIYSSMLGTTRKYAMWLREALEADLSKANAGRRSALDYDLIIVCSQHGSVDDDRPHGAYLLGCGMDRLDAYHTTELFESSGGPRFEP